MYENNVLIMHSKNLALCQHKKVNNCSFPLLEKAADVTANLKSQCKKKVMRNSFCVTIAAAGLPAL
jgi:hypothetical protein